MISKDKIMVTLVILCVVSLTYSMAVQVPFAFHNDLGVLTYVHGNGHFEDWPEGRELIPIGRPVNAVLSNFQFIFIKEISDFTPFRAIAIALVAVITVAFWLWMATFAMDYIVAAAVAVSIFLLPSIQLSIVWNTQLVPGILPMLLVLAAAMLLHYDPFSQVSSLLGGINVRMVIFSALASLLLTFVNFIYPPTTALFLLPTLACVLFLPEERWAGTRRLVARDVMVYLSSCLLFFFLQKYVIGPYLNPLERGHGDPTFQLKIGEHLLDDFGQLFGVGGSIALHLWDITRSWWSIAAVLCILLGGLVAMFADLRRTAQHLRIPYRIWAQRFAAVAGLFVVGNTPNLVSPLPLIAFRTLFVLSAMTALIVFKALLSATIFWRESDRLFVQRFLLVAITVLIAISAQRTVAGASINAHQEMEVLRSWYEPGYLERQMNVVAQFRGVPLDVRHSGRPALHIAPRNNLLGMYLPMEFGLWYKRNEALEFLAREYLGVGVDTPFSMEEFLLDGGMHQADWTRPNPWPSLWMYYGVWDQFEWFPVP